MKYIKKFKNLFRKKEKITFDQTLINLQKFIDSICPEEITINIRGFYIFKIKVNNISVEKIKIDDLPFEIKQQFQPHFTNKDFKSDHRLEVNKNNKIRILISQDDDNQIFIFLKYNDRMKFDLESLHVDSISSVYAKIKGEKKIYSIWSSVDIKFLFDEIKNYLGENGLIQLGFSLSGNSIMH